MHIKIRLGNDTRQQLIVRHQYVYTTEKLQLIRRIHAMFYIADGPRPIQRHFRVEYFPYYINRVWWDTRRQGNYALTEGYAVPF